MHGGANGDGNGMADFFLSACKVLRHEGVALEEDGTPFPGRTGYVNHPDDPGGETNYGITQRLARRYGYDGPMAAIPFDMVRRIYREEFWDDFRGDDVPDQQIADELFDSGVNMGMHRVKVFLQRTLNVLNKQGTLYPDLKVDGVVGPITIAILAQALAVAPYYRLCILRALDSLQCVRYIELAERSQKFETFMPGWLRMRVGTGE